MDNRDDFSLKTIETLRGRVSHRCSNPNCRVPTSGPTTDPQKISSIGVAAHITAASPGGPRYDPVLTPEERKGINNAIWLCANCSIEIDRDPPLYDVTLLKSWKKQAEETAKNELGNKIPSNEDAINTVAAALTGLPTTFVSQAISNVCKASAKALENLDSRFMVKASYQNNQSSFSIFAKEKVDCKLRIEDAFKKEFSEKYKELINHGESLEIDRRAVKISGSKLLETISNNADQGKFRISSSLRKSAIQKIWLTNDKNHNFILNDINGELILGLKSVTFKGSAYYGLFEFKYRFEFQGSNESKLTPTISIHVQKWHGKSLNMLQHFDRLYQFFTHLMDGWFFNTKLEVEGQDVYKGGLGKINNQDEIKNFYLLFRYVYLARAVLSHFNKSIIFNEQFEYSEDVHERLHEVYSIITGDTVSKSDQIGDNATCTIVADDDLANVRMVMSRSEPVAIKFEQTINNTITLCGTSIELPRLYHLLSKVKPKLPTDIANIFPGQSVTIEWLPEPDCEHIIGFITDETTSSQPQGSSNV